MPILESRVEVGFVRRLDARGFMHVKLNLQGRRGWPDRMVILPNGRVVFVELKRPGEKLRPLQEHVHEALRDMGHSVGVFDDADEALDYVLEKARG